jgi:uncharacterized protein YqgV (UPF0045/DUF77 family)
MVPYAFGVNESLRVEFIVEPFVIDEPGPHVVAAVDVASKAGLNPDMGPFATSATGDLDAVISTIGDVVRAGFLNGATSVQFRIDAGNQAPRPGLHDALDRMIADVEREAGTPIGEMSRVDKQHAVARLEGHGAFLLRGSVEEVATMMNVSKVTLYAYINAVTED